MGPLKSGANTQQERQTKQTYSLCSSVWSQRNEMNKRSMLVQTLHLNDWVQKITIKVLKISPDSFAKLTNQITITHQGIK